MSLSLIQPVRMWATDLWLRSNPSYSLSLDSERPDPEVRVTNWLDEQRGAPVVPLYRCRMSLLVNPEQQPRSIPYTIRLNVAGVFRFLPYAGLDANEMKQMAGRHGVAMLYGFARNLVMQHTALAEHGPFVLPALEVASSNIAVVEETDTVHETRQKEQAAPVGTGESVDQVAPSPMYVVVRLIEEPNPDEYGPPYVTEVDSAVVLKMADQARSVARQWLWEQGVPIVDVRVFRVPNFDADSDVCLIDRETVESWIDEDE